MRPAQELLTVVRARAAGTPCVVHPTSDGFDVQLDVDDPRWFAQLRTWGLTETATHHVQAIEAERRLRITDERRSLRWVRDGDGGEHPALGPAGEIVGGDLAPAGAQAVTVGRDLVVDAATMLGWTVRRSLRETVFSPLGLRRTGRSSRASHRARPA